MIHRTGVHEEMVSPMCRTCLATLPCSKQFVALVAHFCICSGPEKSELRKHHKKNDH